MLCDAPSLPPPPQRCRGLGGEVGPGMLDKGRMCPRCSVTAISKARWDGPAVSRHAVQVPNMRLQKLETCIIMPRTI